MNSTDEAKVRRLFRERVVPAAEQLAARGVELFPLGPDPQAQTWWEPGPENDPEFIEVAPEEMAEALRSRWQAEGMPELAELAEPLMELARQLEISQEQSADISPFVYVMY